MFITEYDEEKAMRDAYDDGYEEGYKRGYKRGYERGYERGVKRGRLTILWEIVQENVITLERAADRMNMSVEEFQRALTEFAIS